jgi:hypothetical protein
MLRTTRESQTSILCHTVTRGLRHKNALFFFQRIRCCSFAQRNVAAAAARLHAASRSNEGSSEVLNQPPGSRRQRQQEAVELRQRYAVKSPRQQ